MVPLFMDKGNDSKNDNGLGESRMYVDYMLFTVIALATSVLMLIRILSSNRRYQEQGSLGLRVPASLCF